MNLKELTRMVQVEVLAVRVVSGTSVSRAEYFLETGR
jgi:hypothetical protein